MSLKKLGRYDLIRVLGKGAMGIVYEGRDPNLDRRVAIKTVKVENLSEEAAAEYEHRFRTEARSAARLQHPNIVSVYDSDRDGDIAFLVMEYIQGDDMKHHLDKGVRYSLEQSLKMVRDLLSALDYAHKQGIVHRDIKPANLLIEPGGRVKLTDFGVARIQDSGEATRTQGSMVGTLKYMSPEQVQGQKIDSRADLFSVGVVLYQLLTDKRPFDGDNDFSIIHQIIGHTPAPPSSFNARLPSAIDAVVARALAKDREQRFATARDFASALQSAIRRAEDATVVPPANPSKRPEGAGTGSRAQSGSGAGAAAGGGSTVTQELELVYWKDIKDSTEPDELDGFLAKFPDGIYADLARKRLRKLSTNGSSPDQTILSGTRPPTNPDMEATRLMHSGTTPSFVAQRAAAVALATDASMPGSSVAAREMTIPPAAVPAAILAAEAEEAAEQDFTRTILQPRAPEVKVDEPVAAAAPKRADPGIGIGDSGGGSARPGAQETAGCDVRGHRRIGRRGHRGGDDDVGQQEPKTRRRTHERGLGSRARARLAAASAAACCKPGRGNGPCQRHLCGGRSQQPGQARERTAPCGECRQAQGRSGVRSRAPAPGRASACAGARGAASCARTRNRGQRQPGGPVQGQGVPVEGVLPGRTVRQARHAQPPAVRPAPRGNPPARRQQDQAGPAVARRCRCCAPRSAPCGGLRKNAAASRAPSGMRFPPRGCPLR